MVAHRNEAALSGFLDAQGHRWCRRVEVVVTDGSKSYRAAVDGHLGHALHVLDRFHVVRWFAAGLTAVRRDVQRRQPRGEVTPAFDPELFRARFELLRRADRLEEVALARLGPLFRRHPRIAVAWQALQTLYAAYEADDKQAALEAIVAFVDLFETGRIPEFADVLHALVEWGDQIIAFHDPRAQRISNGRLEGTNNKLQVLRTGDRITTTENSGAHPMIPPSL